MGLICYDCHMNKLDYESIRKHWVNNATAEASLWLNHIDNKKKTITDSYKIDRVLFFEQGELLFNVFSYLNWLAHIDLRKPKHISEKEMVEWLRRTTTWPTEAVEAFWYCLRNPIMHIGRTFLFSDHDRKTLSKLKLFADLQADLNFDPLRFQPEEFKPTSDQDGWMATFDPEDDKKLDVIFYFPGIRRKLDLVLGSVIKNISEADNNSLESLSKVNRKLLPFRITAA